MGSSRTMEKRGHHICQVGDYQVRQKGDIINVFSEDEWYLVNDEIGEAVATIGNAYYRCSDGDCVGKNLKKTGIAEVSRSASMAAANSAKP